MKAILPLGKCLPVSFCPLTGLNSTTAHYLLYLSLLLLLQKLCGCIPRQRSGNDFPSEIGTDNTGAQ